MFADTIDAMTSERPYRHSLGQDSSAEIILREESNLILSYRSNSCGSRWSVLFRKTEQPAHPSSLTLVGRGESSDGRLGTSVLAA